MNTEQHERIKCLIIGSGPAGYTAAIYTARADLKPVLYTGLLIGGQLTKTSDVENYPGYPDGIMGPEMMEGFHKQASRMGADLRIGFASEVDFSERPYKVTIDENKVLLADSVIIATGATPKLLGLDSEEQYSGHGVSACATCDGFFFKGEDVAIVGAGDTAAEEALHLSKLCRKVYMLVRKSNFRASKTMVHRVENTPNIEIMFNVEVKEILGDGVKVNGARLFHNITSEETKLDVTGLFLAIGHRPNTGVFSPWIDMDNVGYIKTKNCSTKTNIPGIFCCGDAQDPNYRQAITAAGSGCMAALDCERFLSAMEHGAIE
ncbi:MAG TPA: thioredoxin-disulfide reductase [Sphingobacterium sp.]|uniref:thioredoxin-disulfide reductase n=1 Tax=Bacteroidota TaxID=976 RepID=UPI0008A41D70|nr:thioredoxin-disulfide reductase [Sphingobacterium sp. HMSC13C05]OFV19233.1 thioredoxin-disulfide reductase [Sphingobacterium sp. HMSC13C05]SJN19964.1 Thioredoxin reductase [Sphingobacterium faecium PCAi_F2.5]HCU45412.1 thioredoxin-disulfide reductase [Sphingobacterium sp.]